MAMIVPGFNDGYTYDGELYHYGKKGMAWGKRQYQNPDGSLTPLGRVHYGIGAGLQSAKNAGSYLTGSDARRQMREASDPSRNMVTNDFAKAAINWNKSGDYKKDGYTKKQADAFTAKQVNKARDVGKSRTRENLYTRQEYNKTLPGQAEHLIRNARSGINSVTSMIGNTPTNIGNSAKAAKERLESAGRTAKETAYNAKEYLTGSDARRQMREASDPSRNMVTNDFAKAAINWNKSGDYKKDGYTKKQADAFTTKQVNKARDVGKSRTRENLYTRQEYNKTLPGQAEKAVRNAKGAASRIGESISKAADDVGRSINSGYKNATNAVSNAYNSASNFAGTQAQNIQTMATNAKENLEQFVETQAENITNFANVMGDKAASTIGDIQRSASKAIDTGKSMIDDAIKGIGSAADSVGSFMSDAASTVANAGSAAFDTGKAFVEEAWKIMKWPF